MLCIDTYAAYHLKKRAVAFQMLLPDRYIKVKKERLMAWGGGNGPGGDGRGETEFRKGHAALVQVDE